MKDKIIKNVLIYTRVSTEEQVEGFSLQNQLDDLSDYAKALKYNVARTFTDAGVSPRFYVSTSKSIIKALINMRSFEIQLSPIG